MTSRLQHGTSTHAQVVLEAIHVRAHQCSIISHGVQRVGGAVDVDGEAFAADEEIL